MNYCKTVLLTFGLLLTCNLPAGTQEKKEDANKQSLLQSETEIDVSQKQVTAENVVKPIKLDPAALSGLGLKRVNNSNEPDRELYQTRLFRGADISVYVVSSETATTTHKSYGMEEFIQVIAGRARLDPDNGKEVIYNTGDCFVAPKGYCGLWETQGGDNKFLIELSVITNRRHQEPVANKPLPVLVDPAKLSGIGLTKVDSKKSDKFRDQIFKGPELNVTLHAQVPQATVIEEPWPEQMIHVLAGSITLTPEKNGKFHPEDAQTFLTGDHFVLPADFKGNCETKGHGLFRYLSVSKSEDMG